MSMYDKLVSAIENVLHEKNIVEDTNLRWCLENSMIKAFAYGWGSDEDHRVLRDAYVDLIKNGHFVKYVPHN